MLTLNQRVRFRGALCQIVAVTPAAGNTMYKLKHVESDKVLDGDFIAEDLEVLTLEEAKEEEDELRELRAEKLASMFGAQPSSDADLRDRKLAAIHEDDEKPPVREAVQRVDGAPQAPLVPGPNDENVESVVGGETDDAPDYSNTEGE